ncbi:MAG: tyrosine-type recombinase/integrase [Opitutaceae bacterium]|nr:tyrosine-type recombinase/integrase [Opitutaceae bacterium]
MDELRALFAAAPKRRTKYLTILYTGQRKKEVKALVWGDLHLEGERPHVLFREDTMKDREKRALPLHPSLAAELRAYRPANAKESAPVFKSLPTWDTLMSDMKKAGIVHKDDLGRVLHFHSFRKTFQTMGVMHGVNQRAAQEFLGHSDANLTAKIYTDVPKDAYYSEIRKLPWVGDTGKMDTPIRSPDSAKTAIPEAFLALVKDFLMVAKTIDIQQIEAVLSSSNMVGPAGFEPATKGL